MKITTEYDKLKISEDRKMKKMKKHKYLLLTILFISLAFFVFGLNSFHNNIWYDEAYQMILNRYSLKDVIYFVSQDFSPPLYAMALKLITTVIPISPLILARLLSFSVFSILFIIAFFPVRRIFGEKTAYLFSTLLLLVYPSFFASIEARTYAFAMTFTLGATIYALSITKREKIIDYILYTLFSILAIYSHNYSIMAIFILDNMLLFYTIFKRKDLIKKVFTCNMIIFIAFLPWISVVSNQAKNLANNFWIKTPTLYTLKNTINYLFTYNQIINIILLITFITIIIWSKKKNIKKTLFIFLPFILTISFFVIYSIWKTPLFAPKYTVPVCALLYLFIAIILSNSKSKILILIFLCLLIPNFITNFKFERQITNDTETKEMVKWINNYTKNKNYAFVESTEFGLGISEYYFPNKQHYIDKDIPIYVKTTKIFGKVKKINYEKDNIKEDLIVCFYLDNYRLQQLEKQGYKIIGKHYFNIRYNNYNEITILKKNF